MKRIVFVGDVGAGKTTLFNALQGDFDLARKTQAIEFNDEGSVDTPGEYFSHPRLYHALINTLADCDVLVYVHAANNPSAGFLPDYSISIPVCAALRLSVKPMHRMRMCPPCASCSPRGGLRNRYLPSTALILMTS